MIRMVFAVYDCKAESFGQPMFVANQAVMFRLMKDEVLREGADNLVAKHPQDFSVYHLGSFEDSKGVFVVEKPHLVFECSAFVEVKDDGC